MADAGAVRALPTPGGTSYDRVPPHNLDAEVSVLGSMLLSKDAIAEVSELVGAEDFYRGAHRTMFEGVRELYDRGEPVDPVTLSDELERRGTLDGVGGAVAIADLIAKVPTAANAAYYARIVADHALRRRLIDAGTHITRLGYGGEDADDSVDAAEALVYQVAQRGYASDFTSMKELLNASFELIERLHENNSAITGLPTGFVDFDELTAGLQPSNLVIVAARPSMGKCLAGSTTVIDPTDGSLRTISDMVAKQRGAVVSLGRDGKLRPVTPAAFHANGVQPVSRLRTRLGRQLVATANHPLLTLDGWLPLGMLAPGARIATPRALPYFGHEELPDAEVALLADLIGGGDPGEATPAGPTGSGLLATRSRARLVPDEVFRLTASQVALFLNRLFAWDGEVWCDATDVHLTYTSVSEDLIRGVQHLLLRFGVAGVIREPRRDDDGGTDPTAWQLRITDPDSIGAFGRRIGVPGVEAALTRTGVAPDGAAGPGSSSSDVLWDEIVAIEAVGQERVYDVTVPDSHNFVAADVIVHNSTLVTNVATHVAVEERRPVVLFSLEMSQMELVQRILSAEAKVDSERLRTGRLKEADWPKLSRAMGRLAEAPLFIDETPGINLMEIRSKCRRLKQKHGLDLIIVDYLQLMQSHRRVENRVQEVGELSRGLKILAKELDVPVIALSQLSRRPEERTDRRPQLADLRESGAIEQDADLVAFIYRDEVYDPESPAKGEAELHVAKHRNGPLRTIHLSFMGHHSRFANLARGPLPGSARPGPDGPL